MGKIELTTWGLIVNCVAMADKPLIIGEELIPYIYAASDRLLKEYPNLLIRTSQSDIAGALMLHKPYLEININDNSISIPRGNFTRETLDEAVNSFLSEDLKYNIPRIIKEAYCEFTDNSQRKNNKGSSSWIYFYPT